MDVATGASEVVAELIVPGPDQLFSLVDGPIARIPGVTGIHTAVVLRLLLTATDWDPYGDEPTPTRRRPHPHPVPDRGGRAAARAADHRRELIGTAAPLRFRGAPLRFCSAAVLPSASPSHCS